MLMVYVGADGRDNMNFHGSMLPRAFEKEQKKNEGAPPVEERGVVVIDGGTHMDRDKDFCRRLPKFNIFYVTSQPRQISKTTGGLTAIIYALRSILFL